ncbi:uncharacterized protein LOC117294769 [Asterias rubens]|uniref:uncharacterized protein LOC117294769 n=1 Tax=Asterias rubens TaxID=7604 RepID=UPI001455B4BC|nr:uncharacterized protein LOC117294769 [Asterias rubens]
MSLDRKTAYEILGISKGASENDIRAAYRHLALKWHPDKHANNDKATEKFQDISAAYKCLTTEDKDAQVLTMDEMFDLFARIFFDSGAFYNGFAVEHSDYDYDDDSDDDDFSWEQVETNRHFTKKQTEFSYTANRPSASEASKNADELMKEEERQKKNREKRKSKKKRQRDKKREEKDKMQEEAIKKEEFLKKARESAEKAKRQAEHRNNSTTSTSYLGATKSSSSSRVNNNTISNSLNSARSQPRAQYDGRAKFKSAADRESESSDSDRDEDTAGWDQQSAFFAGAAATANKKMTTNSKPEKSRKKSSAKGGGKEEAESIDSMDPVVLQSRQCAVKGNEMANLGHYSTAIDLFTQAISLDPRDFRFFGNRSFCYDRLQQCDSALKDANRAISLAKEWPKGYFRKGRALAGLKRYAEAETAFEHVLKLDKNCEDAVEELHKTRISRLMEMGFNRPQCDAAIRQYGSVQSALDALLINGVEGVSNTFPEDVYISDEEDYITQTIETSKLDARNPLSLRSLWVGNLHSTVSEKELRDQFGQFGEIESLRRLPDRFCAFINYKRPEEAALALDQLQGVEVGGRFLLIKFPDNPIVDGQPRTTVLKKNTTASASTPNTSNSSNSSSSSGSHTKVPTSQQQQQFAGKGASALSNYNNHTDASGDKVTGPVNGNECYFWRTTGCVFGDRCKYKHLAKAKGADLKPWQKVVYD